MTTTQLFFAIAGLMVAQAGALGTAFKLYIDAKIDPLASQVNLLVQYMIDHEGRIAKLEERTKGLK